MSYKIVVARYNEDITWLSSEHANCIIYNKGEPLNIDNEIMLPNLGRESETYLRYIITNYDNLPDVVVFTQARISDHYVGNNSVDFLINMKNQALNNSISQNFFTHNDVGKSIHWDKTWNLQNGQYYLQDNYKDNKPITFIEWFKRNIDPNFPNPINIYCNALFAVSKENIKSRTHDYYKNLILEVNHHVNSAEGHFFERSWYYIFTTNHQKYKTNQIHMDDLNIPLVVSFENNFDKNENSSFFKKTLDNNKWEYIFIGEGVVWQGFKTRIHSYYNYLRQLPDEKIIILSDARDVFCMRNPLTFIDCFKTKNIDLNEKIVVSAEMFLIKHMDWSDEQIAKVKQRDPHYFWQGVHLTNYWTYHNKDFLPTRKYVNAGLIVGKVKMLRQAYEWIIARNYDDDQLAFSCYTNEHPNRVHLDYNAEIIHTSGFGVNAGLYSYKQNIDSPSFAEMMGMSSYFLHIPGNIGSMGQKHIYELTKKMIELKVFNQEEMLKLYGNIKLNSNYEYNVFDINIR